MGDRGRGVGELAGAVAPARRVAFSILREIAHGMGHSDVLLRSAEMDGLERVDRNLATALVMGVLRWQIALDAAIVPLLARPEELPPTEVLLSLRMGAFQLRHLDRVPVHAAVDESVELCRVGGQPQAVGMVNAVLRRLAREGRGRGGVPIYETVPAFAQRLGHPAWMAERWTKTYGRDAAMRICEAGQREPVAGGLSGGAGEVARSVAEGSAPAPAREGSDGKDAAEVVTADPLVRSLAGVEEGAWDPEDAEPGRGVWAMDDGSRLVAELTAIAAPGARRVWDCCAAPGGKTMVLLERLPAAAVLASDVHARRLDAMRQRFMDAGVAGELLQTTVCGAEDLPEGEGAFDLVLCDVPCSGTGTLARNPEIRHRLRPAELSRQARQQAKILRAALARVAPGGRLVYATCSLEPEECEAVVAEVARDWVRVPVMELLRELVARGIVGSSVAVESMVRGDALRTLPGVHPCDGFFAVVLERTQE